MIDIVFSIVNNPRTPDGQWENMESCHGCGKVSSAYVRLDIYQDHCRICRNIKLCKRCLCECEGSIDKEILKQCSQRVE